jgi:hypothetical protein
MIDSIMKPKFRIRQLWNRFATRNQWFNEATEMMRTSVLPHNQHSWFFQNLYC